MPDPSLRTSRIVIAIATVLATILGIGGFVIGRSTAPKPPQVVTPAESAVKPGPAVPQGALGRAELIALANSSADALLSGADAEDKLVAAAGRRIELVIPFGCNGPAREGSKDPLRWRYDAERRILRAHVSPTMWDMKDWLPPIPVRQNGDDNAADDTHQTGRAADTQQTQAPVKAAADAAAGDGSLSDSAAADERRLLEGFWVTRPWTSAEQCPPVPETMAAVAPLPDAATGGDKGENPATTRGNPLLAGAQGVPAAGQAGPPWPVEQTLAIAEVLPADTRRDTNPRRFDVVQRVANRSFDGSLGFRLRVLGRIMRGTDGRTVRCVQPYGVDYRPICLVTVQFDELRIENPATGEVLGIWNQRRSD